MVIVRFPPFCGEEKAERRLLAKEGRDQAKSPADLDASVETRSSRLAQTSGKPLAQVARELDISDPSLHQWLKRAS